MNTDILRAGDNVEIRIMQQVGQSWNTGESPQTYASKIQNILDNGDIEIDMPTREGKRIAFPSGLRLEFLFYVKNGIYRCVGHVKDRYKQENLYLLLIEPKTPLEKFQRREFYRLECSLDVSYQVVREDELEIMPLAEMKEHHRLYYPEDLEKEAIAVNISGGGMRFVGNEPCAEGGYLVVTLPLQNKNSDSMELLAYVLGCQQIKRDTGRMSEKLKKYECRVKFLMKKSEDRERIIKYIFEQERLRRQKR